MPLDSESVIRSPVAGRSRANSTVSRMKTAHDEELDAVVVEVAPPALLAFFSLVYLVS